MYKCLKYAWNILKYVQNYYTCIHNMQRARYLNDNYKYDAFEKDDFYYNDKRISNKC